MSILTRYHFRFNAESELHSEKTVAGYALFVSVAFLSILWLVTLVGMEFDMPLTNYGVYPRSWLGLRGILFSPMIHADLTHLMANSPALLVLVFTLFFFYRRAAPLIFLLIYFFSGLFVWLGGREAWHIGASGLIYGFAAFLFLGGVLSNHIRLLTISMLVALLYGSLFWGIFPIKPEVSWESHLWGALSGFSLAIVFRNSLPGMQVPTQEEEEEVVDFEWHEKGEMEDNSEKDQNEPLL